MTTIDVQAIGQVWAEKYASLSPVQMIRWMLSPEVDSAMLSYLEFGSDVVEGLRASMLTEAMEDEATRVILEPAMDDLVEMHRRGLLEGRHLVGLHPSLDPTIANVIRSNQWCTAGWLYAHHNPTFIFHVSTGLLHDEDWWTGQDASLALALNDAIGEGKLDVETVKTLIKRYHHHVGARGTLPDLALMDIRARETRFAAMAELLAASRSCGNGWRDHNLESVLKQGRWFQREIQGTSIRLLLDRVEGSISPLCP